MRRGMVVLRVSWDRWVKGEEDVTIPPTYESDGFCIATWRSAGGGVFGFGIQICILR